MSSPGLAVGKTWQRVAVVGASGTGKTDLTATLAGTLCLPTVSLDALRWPDGRTASDAEFAERLRDVTAGPRWVLEGAESSEPVRAAWRQADALVWLDHNRAGVAVRMFADTSWWRTSHRLGYARYLAGKARRSWRQATRLRRSLPPVLDELGRAGIQVVRLRSIQRTRRWRRAVEAGRTGQR